MRCRLAQGPPRARLSAPLLTLLSPVLGPPGGLQVVWGDPTNPAHYPEGPFDIVYDNNGKDLETCQPLIDHFKASMHTAPHACRVDAALAAPAPLAPRALVHRGLGALPAAGRHCLEGVPRAAPSVPAAAVMARASAARLLDHRAALGHGL